MIDQATDALKAMTGATKCELVQLPNDRHPYPSVQFHAVWNLQFDIRNGLKDPKTFGTFFSDFWDEATRVISIPRIKVLECENRDLRDRINDMHKKMADLERYKTAWELNK